MKHLRNVTARPELVVDPTPNRIVAVDNELLVTLGIEGPFGRQRLVTALPPNKGSGVVEVAPREALCDPDGTLLLDPYSGSVVGASNGIRAHRWLQAARTIDTRRL